MVCSLKVINNRNIILASGGVQEIRLWDVSDFSCIGVLSGHTSWINVLEVVNSNGHILLVSGGDDKSIMFYNFQTKKLVHTLTCQRPVVSLQPFHKEGRTYIASAYHNDDRVKLWTEIERNK